MDQTAARPVNRGGAPPHPATARVAGHFGELVQGRLGARGPLALVTLRCPALVTEVCFAPDEGGLEVPEPVSAKLRAAAELALALVAPTGWGGRIEVRRASPPGTGAGSSTADVLGTLRAVAGAFGRRLSAEEEARLCLAAEGAVDPLMHESTVLFAPREARVLRRLPPLPRMTVVGGFAGPGKATDPADTDFPDMRAAFARLAEALDAADVAGVAGAAADSARANQAHNPNPAWADVLRVGAAIDALGPVVAHTGSAIGLILPPGADSAAARRSLEALGLAGVAAFSPSL